jgi:hypothetical protein
VPDDDDDDDGCGGGWGTPEEDATLSHLLLPWSQDREVLPSGSNVLSTHRVGQGVTYSETNCDDAFWEMHPLVHQQATR